VVVRLGVLPSIASASSVLSPSGTRFEVFGASRCGPDGVDSVGAETVRVCCGFWEVFDGCKRGRRDGDIFGLGSSGALRGLVEVGGTIGVLGNWYEGELLGGSPFGEASEASISCSSSWSSLSCCRSDALLIAIPHSRRTKVGFWTMTVADSWSHTSLF
jgi:hypothetical protein